MSFFDHIEPHPPDPIFGLAAQFKKDKNPNKVDLTVGIYKDASLKTTVMQCVKEAESLMLQGILQGQNDKSYLPISGIDSFVNASQKLLFGESLFQSLQGRLHGIQALGGTGALRLAGEFFEQEVTKRVYLSDPTWPNHFGIFESAGMEVKTYPYYDKNRHAINFEALTAALSEAPPKSVVVLHACCHNPTGCDPSHSEWKALSDLMLKKKLIPLFDCAYQGFGEGLEEDAFAIRYFAEKGHEFFVASSHSKNFGLYGERVGLLSFVCKNEIVSQNSASVLRFLARTNYSNPPIHGAGVVATILHDARLKKMWESELEAMRLRCETMKLVLYEALSKKFGESRFSYLKKRRGMFSLLGIEAVHADRMKEEYGVYMTRSGRINLSGLSDENLPYVIEALIKTMG